MTIQMLVKLKVANTTNHTIKRNGKWYTEPKVSKEPSKVNKIYGAKNEKMFKL